MRQHYRLAWKASSHSLIKSKFIIDNSKIHTAPSSIPQEVTAVALSTKSVKLSWMLIKSVGEIVDGFYVGYKPISRVINPYDETTFTYKTMHINANKNHVNKSSADDGDVMPSEADLQGVQRSAADRHHSSFKRKFDFQLDSMRRATRYIITIQSFNSKGGGPPSDEITVETFELGQYFSKRDAQTFRSLMTRFKSMSFS